MSRLRRLLNPAAGLVSGMCLAVATVVAASDDAIVVGGEYGYEPYETIDSDGEPVGFNVDLMRAIAEEMDREVRFEIGAWSEMRDKLESGEIDVLGMFVSDERRQSVQFANPHVIVNHRIFVPADAERVRSIADLEGKSVIVQESAFSHEYLLKAGFEVDLELVGNDAEGLRLLAEGEHDAALLTEHRGRFTLSQGDFDSLTVSGPPVLPVEYALAVRRGNEELLDLLNTGLERVTVSGAFDRIYARWLQPFDPGRDASFNGRTVLASAILIMVILAAVAIWQMRNLTLTRAANREAQQQLEFLRRHDALTGLLNRRALESRLDQFVEGADIDKRTHTLLSINVDQFRLINEHLGHARADRLLHALGRTLLDLLPEDGIAARLGGDEFAVLLPATDTEAAVTFGQQLLEAARLVGHADDVPGMRVTLSIGVVTFQGEETTVPQLLRRADCACLAAKEDGGDRVHTWRSDDRRLAEKRGLLRWVGRIQSALHENRLASYWQFIMPTQESSASLPSVEILVRMLTPEGEVIAAGQFMPAAERYFLSIQIDRRMVDSTIDWMEMNPHTVSRLETVNINLSGRSLGDSHFLEFLEQRLSDSDMIGKLCIEVTETALIANLSMARETLERLHGKGCRIALDDFGIGLSSMGYLRELPVDFVKIDGSFVRGIDRDAEALSMVREINQLGHAMGKLTVAECVETNAVRDHLRQIGVNYLQGYLYGRPAALGELPGQFDNGNRGSAGRHDNDQLHG